MGFLQKFASDKANWKSVGVGVLLWAISSTLWAEEKTAKAPTAPVLKENTRWQTLPWNYTEVYFDHQNRPWLYQNYGYTSPAQKSAQLVDPKDRMTLLICPEMPEDFIELPQRNTRLGFDRQGRFWEIGKYGLAATDPVRGTFIQHRPLEPASEEDAARLKKMEVAFAPFLFEHSSGRLYFVGWQGIHWLENDPDGKPQWSSHRFEKPIFSAGGDIAYGAKIIGFEGPDGRFYLWFRYLNQGLFVHDGQRWDFLSENAEPRLREVESLKLLDDGTLEGTRLGGVATINIPQLKQPGDANPPASNQKPEQQPAVRTLGRAIYQPGLQGPEAGSLTDGPLSVYGRVQGKDSVGRVYIRGWGEQNCLGCEPEVIVFDPRVKDDAVRFPVEAIPIKTEGGWRPVIISPQGHVWTRMPIDKRPFLSRYANGEWTHFPDPSLPAEIPETDDTPRELILYQGSQWLNRPLGAPATWKLDRPHCYVGIPAMANVGLLQPLKDGSLIALESGSYRAFFFDGKGWSEHLTVFDLVEKRYVALKANLKNNLPYWGHSQVSIDATGRIFAGDFYARIQIYDGETWEKTELRSCALDPTGRRCWTGEMLWDTSVNPAKMISAEKIVNKTSKDILVSRGFSGDGWFLFENRIQPTEENKAFREGELFERGPLFEDSQGRLWFQNFSTLAVLSPGGALAELKFPKAQVHPAVAEQSPNVFWAAATDGLLKLNLLEQPNGKIELKIAAHYPRIVPQGTTRWMGIDDQQHLWITCWGNEMPVCRIEIPPLEPVAAKTTGENTQTAKEGAAP